MLISNTGASCVLDDDESCRVRKIIEATVPPYYPEVYNSFVAGCRNAALELPKTILAWVDRVKTQEFGVIRNLPIDDPLPHTPTIKNAADSNIMLSDSVIGTISALFGTLYTIRGKGTGRHIQNMYPVMSDQYTQLATSSKVDLLWHVEEAFHPARPTWLGLLCLRGDSEAITKIARARDLVLEPSVLRILCEPRFRLLLDETYADRGSFDFISTRVLSGPPGANPEIVFDPAYTAIQDEVEVSAVNAVACAAEEASQRFVLEGGDMMVLNNRRVVHARSAFRARKDGTDRWLKRAFILDAPEWTAKLTNGVIPFG